MYLGLQRSHALIATVPDHDGSGTVGKIPLINNGREDYFWNRRWMGVCVKERGRGVAK